MKKGRNEQKADGDRDRSLGLILLVEDDELVRQFANTALTGAGYTIREAVEADTAQLLLSAYPNIALVMTDVAIPGQMNGVGLAHVISHEKPDLPVIVSSAAFPPGSRGLPVGARFLQKPYSSVDLIALVAQTLSSSKGP